MTSFRNILLGLILCLLTNNIIGRDYYFKNYKVEEGLSQNSVYCILQDHMGFMWFGTNDGLNRFDGYNFKNFRHSNDSTGLGSNKITALHEMPDGNIYIGTANGLYIYDPLTELISKFKYTFSNNETIHSRITSLTQDNNNNLWFSTQNQGIIKYSTSNHQIWHYSAEDGGLPFNNINRIFIDSQQRIWLSLANALCLYNPSLEQITYLNLFNDGHHTQNDYVTKIYEDDQNEIWIGTDNSGLFHYKRELSNFENYFGKDSDHYLPHIHDIYEISQGELIIGSDKSPIVFNPNSNKLEEITPSNNAGALNDQSIYCFYKDREGGLWLGSYFGGVNYLAPPIKPVELYQQSSYNLSGKAISRFCEMPNGNIWVASEDGGLNLFDIHTKSFTNYLKGNNVQALCLDKENLWIGTFGYGLFKMDIHSKKVSQFDFKYEGVSTLHIKSIFKDSKNNVWLGTNAGLFVYNKSVDSFILYNHTRGLFIWDILEDNDGKIWFCTSGNGLYKLTSESGKLINYRHISSDNTSLPEDNVLTICKDIKGNIWAASEEKGFCMYNPLKDNFTRYNNIEGYSNRLIYSILSDASNKIWLATSNGLFKFDPVTNKIAMFTNSDGLQSNQFNFNSGYRATNGKLYFGGVNGFNAFFPDQLKLNTYAPPVKIIKLQLFNKEVEINGPSEILNKAIFQTEEITLKHKQNVFSFDFVALSYVNSANNQYAYMMEGFDKQWQTASLHRRATYTNLPAGTYVFKVKGANSDWYWNDTPAQIIVNIKPPFWRTIYAYFGYLIILILLVYAIVYNSIRKERRKQEAINIKSNMDREKSLYNSQMNFFTNIAHEIRTPLTLIKAPVEDILKSPNLPLNIKENLLIVDKNTNSLFNLVTELLDFRKTEHELKSKTHVPLNILSILKEAAERASSSALSLNINLVLQSATDEIIVNGNREVIDKIIMNLISNALKFASSQITLSVKKEQDSAFIQIKDDGIGVPANKSESIFQPFTKISENENKNKTGMGLGLSYAKSLAQLHKGSLELDTTYQNGACFNLLLPLSSDEESLSYQKHLKPKNNELNSNLLKGQKHTNTILVVEDNDDLRNFITKSLSEKYSVLNAADGQQALDLLANNSVSLVITDVMMPVMDGLELTKIIKTKVDYSHIPVIMLTAKTTNNAKIEGYEVGADAYIDKPFAMDLLKVRIINLLENRERLLAKFQGLPLVKSSTIANTKTDVEFIERMKETIIQHILDENFNVDILASHLNMSRSGLFAKIKGISGLSPLDYIKLERLKKAAEYLMEDKYLWSDIAQMIGYSTPSYFSKEFKKQFGVTPRDFKKSKA